MRRIVAIAVLILGLTTCRPFEAQNARDIVLPDFKLAGSNVANLSQIWLDRRQPDTSAIYPKQVSIDMEDGVVQGLTAIYDQSVSVDQIQAEISKRYGKFAMARFEKLPIMLWRVEPEKFAISLSVADDGMKQLIYLKFAAKSVRAGWKCKFAK